MAFRSIGLVCLVLLSLSLCSSGLKSITVKQLEQLVPKTELVFVVFHSDVEHLKELSKRVLEEVDRISAAITERVKFYSMDLEDNKEAVSIFGLTDIPSIVLFRDGYHRIYYGQRTGFTMYSFIQDLLTNDPVKLLSHKQDKKQFTDGDAVKVVGYFSKDKVGSIDLFRQAAKQFQGDISFAIVHDPKLAKGFKLKSEDEIIILKPGEKQILSPSIFTNRDDLVQWIEENKKPLWAELTYNNLYYVWQGTRITFVAFVKNVEEHHSKTILSIFESLAKQYAIQNHICFVIVDTSRYKEFSQGLGLAEEDIPTFAIFDPFRRKEHFFPKDQFQINSKHTTKWVENFLSGKLETPEQLYSEEDSVVQLTADTFSNVVYDQEKDVLVEFYAPWCGHCIALAPLYKKIASLLRLLPSVVIASFDAQASQPPEKYDIQGFPTLLFFSSKDKDNAIPVPGPHEGLKLIDFILEHQTAATEETIEQFKQILTNLSQQQYSDEQEPSSEESPEDTEAETENDNREEL